MANIYIYLYSAYPNEEHLMPMDFFWGMDNSKMVLKAQSPSELRKKLTSKHEGTVAREVASMKTIWVGQSR